MSGTFMSFTRFESVAFPLFVAWGAFLGRPGRGWTRLVVLGVSGCLHLWLLWRFVNFRWGGLSVLVDAVGRETKRFGCYSLSEADTNRAAATSVAGNTVQEQIEQAYDTAGNVTQGLSHFE